MNIENPREKIWESMIISVFPLLNEESWNLSKSIQNSIFILNSYSAFYEYEY